MTPANADPATISDFRLDTYEVTVGRFRSFVNAVVDDGYLPKAGAGVHGHLHRGLSVNGGTETGWDACWDAKLYPTIAQWNGALTMESAAADHS